jgi:hypothetical protein
MSPSNCLIGVLIRLFHQNIHTFSFSPSQPHDQCRQPLQSVFSLQTATLCIPIIAQPLQFVLSSLQRATTDCILVTADSYQVTKYLMSSGKFWMVSPDPEQPATPQLVPIMKNGYYYKFGVFLDYDCRDSKQYLDEVSVSHYNRLSLSTTSRNVRHILNRQQTYDKKKFLRISTDYHPIGLYSRYVIPSKRQPHGTKSLSIQSHPLLGHSERRGAVRVVTTPASYEYYNSSGLKSLPGDRLSLFIFLKSPAVPQVKCRYRASNSVMIASLRVLSKVLLTNHQTVMHFCVFWVTVRHYINHK